MSEHASGTFDIDGWDETGKDEKPDGTAIGRVKVTKTFHGGLTGGSVTEIQTVGTAAGPAAYVGIEHVEGTLNGRTGTFVLQHSAGADDTGQWLKWLIVPGTGTGELAGLRGEGTIKIDGDSHTYTLDYEVG